MNFVALKVTSQSKTPKRIIFSSVVWVLILWSVTSSLPAQTTATVPPVDDQELYIAALRFAGKMTDFAQKSDSTQATYMQSALCREMGVSAADLAIIINFSKSSELMIWQGSASKSPVYGDARTTAANSLIKQLSTSLSPKGRISFRNFVNGRFRQSSIKMSQRGATK